MIYGDAFSVATLLYTRLRRVSGRVIDAMYLVQNQDYAQHVIELAEQTEDPELLRFSGQLRSILALEQPISEVVLEQELEVVEPTEEDIYRAQVSHRYIGALR